MANKLEFEYNSDDLSEPSNPLSERPPLRNVNTYNPHKDKWYDMHWLSYELKKARTTARGYKDTARVKQLTKLNRHVRYRNSMSENTCDKKNIKSPYSCTATFFKVCPELREKSDEMFIYYKNHCESTKFSNR